MNNLTRKPIPRTKTANKLWHYILDFLNRSHPDYGQFTLEEAAYFIKRENLLVARESLRVQFARYAHQGYLTKTGHAKYQLNEKGKAYFTLNSNEEDRI